jgi:hypothetical protein
MKPPGPTRRRCNADFHPESPNSFAAIIKRFTDCKHQTISIAIFNCMSTRTPAFYPAGLAGVYTAH